MRHRCGFGTRQALVEFQDGGALLEAVAASLFGYQQRTQFILVGASGLDQFCR